MTTRHHRRLAGSLTTLLLAPLALAVLPATPAHAAPPSNDAFANATTLVKNQNGTTTGATPEPGDPTVGGRTSTSTVWYRTQTSGPALLDLEITDAGYDTLLSVYEGTSLGSLSLVAQNDDGAPNRRSRLENVLVQPNRTYYVVVAGYQQDTGSFTLEADGHQTPTNDAFADASPLLAEGVNGANLGATRETGEGIHGPHGTSQTSVWWTITPGHDGYLGLSMAGSEPFDSVMALYTMSAGEQLVPSLTQLANDDDSGPDALSELTDIPVVENRTYWVAVSGFHAQTGAIRLFQDLRPVDDPVVTGVNQRAVSARGGQRVTLRGHGFSATSQVTVGSGDAGAFGTAPTVSPDGTRLTFTAPAMPRGSRQVVVTNEFGTSPATAAARLLYLGRPRVTQLSRHRGPAGRRAVVTVRGTDLRYATRVLVAGRAVRATHRGATLRVTLPARRAGTVALRVVTPGGTSPASRATRYTYLRPRSR